MPRGAKSSLELEKIINELKEGIKTLKEENQLLKERIQLLEPRKGEYSDKEFDRETNTQFNISEQEILNLLWHINEDKYQTVTKTLLPRLLNRLNLRIDRSQGVIEKPTL